MLNQKRHYNLNVQKAAEPNRVISKEQYQAMQHGHGQTPSQIFCFGEAVQYLSRSTGQWIPAVVQGHVMLNSELHYHLDVQEAAPFQRVKSAAVTLPDELPMAPTIAALDVLERGEEKLRKEKREVEVKDVDVETPSMFTFASGKMLQKLVSDETLEDSIALRVASTARPKAKAAGKGQFSESEGGTLPTPERVEPSLQDLKSFLERVERPSNLFSQKTFLDEPHFGLEISKHGTLPDAELSELSVSLPVARNLPDDSNRCFQEMEKPPEPGGSGSSRPERTSDSRAKIQRKLPIRADAAGLLQLRRNAPMKQVQRIVNPLLKAPGFEEKAMFLDDTASSQSWFSHLSLLSQMPSCDHEAFRCSVLVLWAILVILTIARNCSIELRSYTYTTITHATPPHQLCSGFSKDSHGCSHCVELSKFWDPGPEWYAETGDSVYYYADAVASRYDGEAVKFCHGANGATKNVNVYFLGKAQGNQGKCILEEYLQELDFLFYAEPSHHYKMKCETGSGTGVYFVMKSGRGPLIPIEVEGQRSWLYIVVSIFKEVVLYTSILYIVWMLLTWTRKQPAVPMENDSDSTEA
eukprot:symbB.v1.2.033827.t1/scaffold4257.1/size42297/1